MNRGYTFFAIAVLVFAVVLLIGLQKNQPRELAIEVPAITTPKAWTCDADALICPDGTIVGRTGSQCEFSACPITKPTPDKKETPQTPAPVIEPEKEEPPVEQKVIVQPTPLIPSGTSPLGPSTYWKNRSNGSYTLAQAVEDYKHSINGWDASRMQIFGGKLRTTLLKNTVGPEGGLVSWIDVPDGDEYRLQFDVMFDSNFDFSLGGKVGFGFLIGEGNTGGVPGTNGNGGSVRLMWYKETHTGRVFLKPYVYYKDQPGQYGDDFGRTYPATGSIAKGTWHSVKMHVKTNTGSSTNGWVEITINGTTLLDQPIRYTTNDAKRLINRITFETFRGGADASWQSATDGYIYFDNVSWESL